MEREINTKRGSFGRIQVTLPMDTKTKMMQWYQKSGLRKAEFFRVALMIGASQLAESVKAKRQDESYSPEDDNLPMGLPGREEDNRMGRLDI